MQSKAFYYHSMGTTWKVSIWDSVDDELFKEIESKVIKDSRDFDNTYSRFINSSLISKIAERPGIWKVPEDFMNMLKWYIELFSATDKKLNPLIGFTISDLGYDENYSLVEKDIIRQTPDLMKVVKIIDEKTVQILESVLFDFGALGKGYFVDKVSRYLKEVGVKRFLVDGSGDIFYEGSGISIKAGLEHPNDPKKVIGVLEIKSGSICASGINRRVWGKNNHVIDPIENKSVTDDIISTWVFAKSAVLADALASCLFFVSPDRLTRKYDFEYLILNKNLGVKKSPGFDAQLF